MALRPHRAGWVAAWSWLLLAGCTVGPNYKGPPEVIIAGRPFARVAAIHVAPGPVQARWWTTLQDRELDRLEIVALSANPDLAAATARLREARAQLHAQQAELRPTTSTSALYLHTQGGTGLLTDSLLGSSSTAASQAALSSAGTAAPAALSDEFDLYDVGFDATWEIDLFGAQRRAMESAAASAEARRADLADGQVTLTADVARAYVSLRDLQHRIALARASAELQGQVLALTQKREAGGTASALDVERLNTQVEQTWTDIVPLQAQVDQQLNQLAILTGRPPGELDAELIQAASPPIPPEMVAVGDPVSLLRRRPDIRAAERQIAAENAIIGQHVADYFPKLELLGNLGFASTDVGQLFSGGSFAAVVAPILQWKPFDFGRTGAAVEQARGGRDEALANYRSTVLKALNDAETGLSRYGNQRLDVAGLERVLASADHAAALTRERYVGGTATLIDTLDTERQRVQAEQALAQAQAELTQDFIALQKSLGLGWQAATLETAQDKT